MNRAVETEGEDFWRVSPVADSDLPNFVVRNEVRGVNDLEVDVCDVCDGDDHAAQSRARLQKLLELIDDDSTDSDW